MVVDTTPPTAPRARQRPWKANQRTLHGVKAIKRDVPSLVIYLSIARRREKKEEEKKKKTKKKKTKKKKP